MDRPIILTAALTGVLATREQCPYIPYTPKEIALEAKRSYDEGASIVHIHAREEDGSASWRKEVFCEIKEEVNKLCPVLLNFSTGGIGQSIQERAANLPFTRPEMAALNMGSMNYAIYSSRKKKFYHSLVFANPFHEIQWLLKTMNELDITPEMECFDTGHIASIKPFMDLGLLKAPFHFSFVMGVLGGIPLQENTLKIMSELVPKESFWQLIGIGKDAWSYLKKSLELGGNIRVGLEDNFYLPNKEMAKSNGELVKAGANLVNSLGLKLATVEETKAFLSH